MEIGEKIKFYRKANKLTQKELADLSGISEISIRKYEGGDRFPKTQQLQKIANALTIGGNELLQVKPDTISIETVGDVITILYALKEKLNIDFSYDLNDDGSINPQTIKIQFDNDNINNSLERIIQEELMAKELQLVLGNKDDEISNTQLLTDQFLLDLTKDELTNNKTPLD